MTSEDDSALRPSAQVQDVEEPALPESEVPNAGLPVRLPAVETPSSPKSEPRLGMLAPVDPRGQHELLRLAAGLAPLLHGPTGDVVSQAIAAYGVEPARVERVVTSVRDTGVIALIDGSLYALGRLTFLEGIGIRPRMAELRAAERIERSGELAYFVVAIARAHCLGVFGAAGAA